MGGVDRCEPGPISPPGQADLWPPKLVPGSRGSDGRRALRRGDAVCGAPLLGRVSSGGSAQAIRPACAVSAPQAGSGAAAVELGHVLRQESARSGIGRKGGPRVLVAVGASDPVPDRVAAVGDPLDRWRSPGSRRHGRARTPKPRPRPEPGCRGRLGDQRLHRVVSDRQARSWLGAPTAKKVFLGSAASRRASSSTMPTSPRSSPPEVDDLHARRPGLCHHNPDAVARVALRRGRRDARPRRSKASRAGTRRIRPIYRGR